MADESTPPPQNNSSLMMVIIIGICAVVGIGAFMVMNQGPTLEVEIPSAEYQVKSNMYQLKDGSYLRLGFSIVIAEDKVESVRNIIEKEAPGRLPSGITMTLGNKSRKDLIEGAHKREAFARELKKILEERVFRDFNKRQSSVKDGIEVREILISEYVTQEG